MPISFSAKNREIFKSEIERSIAPNIMKLIDKVNGRVTNLVNNLEDKFQLMEVKIESLAEEYNGRQTTRNSRKTPSPKTKPIKTRKFRTPPPIPINKQTNPRKFRTPPPIPPTRKPPSPPHGGQRKKNKTRKFRKSSH